MLEVKYLVTPSPEQFEIVIESMRLPFKSGDKCDSELCEPYENYQEKSYCKNCTFKWTNECDDPWIYSGFVLGEKDKQLLLNLCKAGDPSHRKVLRQLPVIIEIKAPLYWWKQVDQYKIGTVTNSESTMHCLTKEPFKLEDFSVENYRSIYGYESEEELKTFEEVITGDLNYFRDRYLETKDKKYWYAINEILPQSYNQTRTWSGNYETLVNIVNQRRGHKLSEWSTLIDYLLENVPYLKEIVEAVNEKD